MRSRIVVIFAFVLASLSSIQLASVQADETDPSQLIKEIEQLKSRIKILEAKVHAYEHDQVRRDPSKVFSRVLKTDPKSGPQSSLPRKGFSNQTPKRIIEMQFERPSELMRNIHARERQMRRRLFPPDSIPAPLQFP